MRAHAASHSFRVGDVEDEQIVGAGARLDGMRSTVRELEVIVHRRRAEHDAVEAGVVREAAELDQAEACAI
ncbi:MAG TPA: hypothetical protein VGH48_14420, partial [Caldimonas sp.]